VTVVASRALPGDSWGTGCSTAVSLFPASIARASGRPSERFASCSPADAAGKGGRSDRPRPVHGDRSTPAQRRWEPRACDRREARRASPAMGRRSPAAPPEGGGNGGQGRNRTNDTRIFRRGRRVDRESEFVFNQHLACACRLGEAASIGLTRPNKVSKGYKFGYSDSAAARRRCLPRCTCSRLKASVCVQLRRPARHFRVARSFSKLPSTRFFFRYSL
jgi:hypothetical protein